jgi:hypothetical protein
MNLLDDGELIRGKLQLPEQRQLWDYWRGLCAEGGLPCKSAFSPAKIPRLLPCLSLIDVADPIKKSTIRLAGTRLREVYGHEITGMAIADVHQSFDCDERLEAYRMVVEEQRPLWGETQLRTPSNRPVVQHWLKLPLRSQSEDIRMVLCLDIVVSSAESLSEKILVTA